MNIKKIETVIKNIHQPVNGEAIIVGTIKLGIGDVNKIWQGNIEDATAKLSVYKATGDMSFGSETYRPNEVTMYTAKQSYKKVIQPRMEDLGEE